LTVPAELTINITLFKKDGFQSTVNKVVSVLLQGPGELQTNSVTLSQVANDDRTLQGTQQLRRRAEDGAGTAIVGATLGTLTSRLEIDFPPAPAPPPPVQ
jgi:hypothetical protein